MNRSVSSQQFLRHIRSFYRRESAGDSSQVKRFQSLVSTFRSKFPESKFFSIVRAPGRVNIIGEHTDYNGYPVMPIAIEQDIAVAFSPTGDRTIRISNTDPGFADRAFEVAENITPGERGDWENYVKAAVQGILGAGLVRLGEATGISAVFDGTIPPAAGLSSSSALVVASALAFLSANRRETDKRVLAELLPKAERYVGTESGGMDQAISLLGEEGKALRIDFFPLRTESVPLPPGYAFVVCNSLVDASKSGVARSGYNLRVVECRLAAALLAHRCSGITGQVVRTNLLSDLAPEKIGIKDESLLELAEEVMGGASLTLSEITGRLGQSEGTVAREHCTLKDGSVLLPPPGGFKPFHRYRHVRSEARRVSDAVTALKAADAPLLGRLMNDSHSSCRDDYEVSCPELETLVELARSHGALGARLTGAGFGGCTVNLLKESLLASFISGMKKDFYGGGEKKKGGKEKKTIEVVFSCHPSRGAGVICEGIENHQ